MRTDTFIRIDPVLMENEDDETEYVATRYGTMEDMLDAIVANPTGCGLAKYYSAKEVADMDKRIRKHEKKVKEEREHEESLTNLLVLFGSREEMHKAYETMQEFFENEEK